MTLLPKISHVGKVGAKVVADDLLLWREGVSCQDNIFL